MLPAVRAEEAMGTMRRDGQQARRGRQRGGREEQRTTGGEDERRVACDTVAGLIGRASQWAGQKSGGAGWFCQQRV